MLASLCGGFFFYHCSLSSPLYPPTVSSHHLTIKLSLWRYEQNWKDEWHWFWQPVGKPALCNSPLPHLLITPVLPYVCLKRPHHEIFCFRFFSWYIFPQAPENNIRVILIFWKFVEIFASAPLASATPAANFITATAGVVNTAPPVANLLLVSTIPAANLPPVSTTQGANCHHSDDTPGQLATGVTDTSVK